MAAAPPGPRADLDLESFRRTLAEEGDRLKQELRDLRARDQTGGPAGETSELADYDQHQADQATELFLREQDQAIHDTLTLELTQVETSLRKLDEGTYGYCERCGKTIPQERLEALPSAVYCLHCADELEGQI